MASKLITSPWRTIFEQFVSSAQNELRILVPFYSRDTVKFILTKARKDVSKRFLLALTENGVKSGIQSTAAIKMLLKDKKCSVQFILDLHAKVLIKDHDGAVVTSSNLTNRGLNSNVEMGMMVGDRHIVEELIGQFETLWLQSKAISKATLDGYDKLPKPAQQMKSGKRFGGSVNLPKHPSAIDKGTLGWILIHKPERFPNQPPQDILATEYKPGHLWHWKLRYPMKQDGSHTLLMAYEQKIFGEAEAEITSKISKKRLPDFNFASN